MWGATDPDFTWLDIEAALYRGGVIGTRSIAAVPGGNGGIGREMDPAGIEAIREAAHRAAVPSIEDKKVAEMVDRLLEEVLDGLGGAASGAGGMVGGGGAGRGEGTGSGLCGG